MKIFMISFLFVTIGVTQAVQHNEINNNLQALAQQSVSEQENLKSAQLFLNKLISGAKPSKEFAEKFEKELKNYENEFYGNDTKNTAQILSSLVQSTNPATEKEKKETSHNRKSTRTSKHSYLDRNYLWKGNAAGKKNQNNQEEDFIPQSFTHRVTRDQLVNALKVYETQKKAGLALGMVQSTVHNYIKKFKINLDEYSNKNKK